MSDAHAGKTVTCYGDRDGDGHDPVTLTYGEQGRFVSSPPRDETGMESSALRFDCPECGATYWVCPVCSEPPDSTDNSPAGWFRGDDTGEQIPCHNCNQEEIAERRRRGRPRADY